MSTTLVVFEPDSFFTEFLAIDFVFSFEVVNQRLLATVFPAGKESEHELQMKILHVPLLALRMRI